MSPLLAIWHLLDARQRRRLMLLQLLAVVMALSTLVGVASLLPFLALVVEPANLARFPWLEGLRTFLDLDRRALVVAVGLGFVLVVVLASAVNLLGSVAIARFAMDAGDGFHAALLAEYLRRDYAFHLRSGSARLFNRVVFVTNRIAHGIVEAGLTLVANAIAALLIMVSIFWVDAGVALAALLWLGGGYLLVYGASRRRLLRNGIEESELITARARIANDSLGSIRDVKLRALEATYAGQFERVCRAISGITLASQSIAQAPRHAMECLTVAGLVAAALFLSRDRSMGVWVAQLSFLGFAAYRLLPAVQQVFVSLVRIRANRALFEEVAPDLASAVAHPRAMAAPSAESLVPRRDIVLESVSFGFATPRSVLRDLHVRIPVGAMVGIAGANGSGKSTLLDLLMGLHVPDSGRVLVDGVEIAAHNRLAWQRSVSCVPQSIHLVNASLAENIAFGVARGDIDAQRLHAAALRARLLPLVEKLPQGFDEPIGNGGRELSGGERQRVAIARALYRDSAVLLMDEATSALDGLSEQEIVELLRTLRGTRTIVLVAHRLNTLRECDRIFELQAGCVAAAGSFVELIGRSKNFRQMAAGYGGATH